MEERLKFHGTATVGTKGQIVIPVEARSEMGLQEGDKLLILGGPHKDSLLIIKGDALKDMLSRMTSKFDSILELIDKDTGNTVKQRRAR